MAKTAKHPKPLLSFVLLEIPPRKEELKGFVVVRDPKKEDRAMAQKGKVLDIGVTKNGFVFLSAEDSVGVKPRFKVGDTVYYSSFTGYQISNKLLFVEYKNIVGVKNA